MLNSSVLLILGLAFVMEALPTHEAREGTQNRPNRVRRYYYGEDRHQDSRIHLHGEVSSAPVTSLTVSQGGNAYETSNNGFPGQYQGAADQSRPGRQNIGYQERYVQTGFGSHNRYLQTVPESQAGYVQTGFESQAGPAKKIGYGQTGHGIQSGYFQASNGQRSPVNGAVDPSYDQGRDLYRQHAEPSFGNRQHPEGYQKFGY